MNKRIFVLLVLGTLFAFAVIFTVARANTGVFFTLPPNKQTAVALQSQAAATAAAGPHAPTPPPSGPIVERASCPQATPEIIGLVPPYEALGPFGDGKELNSRADTMSKSGDVIYWI